ncbi:tetratricopeptide repeat protein [Opitutales bacterium]|nr:tetratricopeptide repeat protein [Opitutales bacterium]
MELDAISLKMVEAMIAMEGGSSQSALQSFLDVLDVNPAESRALLFVGQLYAQQGDIDEAGAYFELAQMYPEVSYDAYYSHAELLLGLGQRAEALDKLRQAATIRPNEGLSQIIRSVEDTGRLVR